MWVMTRSALLCKQSDQGHCYPLPVNVDATTISINTDNRDQIARRQLFGGVQILHKSPFSALCVMHIESSDRKGY